MRGRFRIVVEYSIITVQHKSGHSPVFITELMHRCYQVLPLTYPDKICTTPTDFWHQALGHSSTGFCNNATNIYADNSIIPKCSSEFFCPACDKYNSKHAVPLPVSSSQSKNPFDLIPWDLLVPLRVESLRCRKYMLRFGEDKTRYSEINFLYKNPHATRLIRAFCKKVNAQTQKYRRSFPTDSGDQIVNGDVEAYFKESPITYQQPSPRHKSPIP